MLNFGPITGIDGDFSCTYLDSETMVCNTLAISPSSYRSTVWNVSSSGMPYDFTNVRKLAMFSI